MLRKMLARPQALRRSIFAISLAVIGIALTACVPTQPVNKPCGVIIDSLESVHATTKQGEVRISKHFERGVRAGCWGRTEAK